MVPWAEPRGGAGTSADTLSNMGYQKIRRFVVVRPKGTHCLCLPINTYSGQGTSKKGVNKKDHAALVPMGCEPSFAPGEAPLQKEPLYLIVEDPEVDANALARINFGKVYTVEYNLMVRKVGRIHPQSLPILEQYFVEVVMPNATPNGYVQTTAQGSSQKFEFIPQDENG